MFCARTTPYFVTAGEIAARFAEADKYRIAAEDHARQERRYALKSLGDKLDEARRLFTRQAEREVLVPTAFARAERRYLAAKEAYRARLVELTGESVEDLERRIAA